MVGGVDGFVMRRSVAALLVLLLVVGMLLFGGVVLAVAVLVALALLVAVGGRAIMRRAVRTREARVCWMVSLTVSAVT